MFSKDSPISRGCHSSSLAARVAIAGAALAVFAGAAGTASAAVISWGAATDVSGNTDVSTTGTFVGAFSLGDNNGSAPSNEVINGVTFTGINAPALGQGYSTSVAAGTDTITGPGFEGYSGYTPPGSLSAAYQSILANGFFNPGVGYLNGPNNSPLDLNLGRLTPGSEYQVEIWVNDGRSISAGNTQTVSGSPSDSVVLQEQTGPLVAGQFAIGTFIADNTGMQTISITAGKVGSYPSQLNAYEVRAVPEPASLGLFAIGAMGLLLVKRRSGGLMK
ncbi:MAG: PEP-CTERM sorting domain-containing protein [Phycisphaerae bacterium]